MIRAFLVLFALFASTVIAAQQPPLPEPKQVRTLELTDQDEQAVRVICEAARTAPSLNLENVANLTQYCLNLLNRIKNAK